MFKAFPEKYIEEIFCRLGDRSGHVNNIAPPKSVDRDAALRLLVEFLDDVANNSLMHLAIATESTEDVISISNIHKKMNKSNLEEPSASDAPFQKEMIDMYQREQTKIMRFAHLTEETFLYDSKLKEVQVLQDSNEISKEENSVSVMSNISSRKLRETWQGLKEPVLLVFCLVTRALHRFRLQLLWLCHRYLLHAKCKNSNEPEGMCNMNLLKRFIFIFFLIRSRGTLPSSKWRIIAPSELGRMRRGP